MMPARTLPGTTRLALAAGLLSAALLTGCSGQGRYTRQQVSLAAERMSVMKSATEWEMGRQAFLAGDLDKAMKKVEASLAINNSVPKSHVLRARILIEKGNMGEALTSLKMAHTLEPGNLEAHYYTGVVYERLDRPEDALRSFQAAAALDEYASQYAIAAAEMLVDLGRLGEAKDYLATRPTYEHSAGIRQTLGHIAMIEGERVRAVEFFNEARLLAPDDTAILEDLIHAQVSVGRYTDAEFNLQALLRDKNYTNRRDLKHLRARCLTEINRPVEARNILVELTRGEEGSIDVAAWISLAEINYLIGDDRNAAQAAARVMSIAPERAEGYAVRALVMRRSGDGAGALASVEQALKKRPQEPSLWTLRAAVLVDLGRIADARESLTRAGELDPANQVIADVLNAPAGGSIANVPTE